MLRIFLGFINSVLSSCFVYYLVYSANNVKQSLTGEPLTWNDIYSVSNVSVVNKYLTIQQVLLVCVFSLIFFVLVVWQSRRGKNKVLAERLYFLGVVLMLIPFSTSPYAGLVKTKEGMRYISWDWKGNVEYNGLLVHLMQTSLRVLPSKPTDQERENYSRLIKSSVKSESVGESPQNIIVVMCEACWHDDNYFKKHFLPLEQLGFSGFRSSSPVYGGGTVNASLEFNLGMPVPGVLTGVVYQEYAPLIPEKAATYARALGDDGYTTFAMHNHVKKFWKRDQVLPKLGYDYFYGIEDMQKGDNSWWADDKSLYDKAIETLKNNPDGRNYFYLTTVYTHGPYPFNGDYGEADYEQRLSASIGRFVRFHRELISIVPNALVLFFADHKPAMNKFFYESGVFPESFFLSVGDKNEDFTFSKHQDLLLKGDVPTYVFHHDAERVSDFLNLASGKPFYCLSYFLNNFFTDVDVPAFKYIESKGSCSKAKREVAFPEWLYSISLLGY